MNSQRGFRTIMAVLLAALTAANPWGIAQQPAPAPAPAPAGGAPSGPPPMKQEELDQLLAPIALYPDSLLSQMFMAATYPLEVVEADRWAKANKNLKDAALT